MARPVPIRLPFAGGVNLLQDPRFVREDQCVRSKNLVPTRSGMAAKRGAIDGLTPTPVIDSDGTFYVASLSLPPASFGNGLVFALRRLGDPGAGEATRVIVSPEVFPIGDTAHVYWGLPSPYRPLVLSYNKQLFLFAGQGNFITAASPVGTVTPIGRLGAVVKEATVGGALVVDGFNFYASDGGATTEPDAVPNVGAVYRNRVFWADFGPGFENYGVMSDPYLPHVVGADFLSAAGRNFLIGARDGDRTVAAREVLMTSVGSASESALLVLRQYSAYLLTGEPNEVDDGDFVLGDFDVNRINVDCGCSSADTLVNTPYGLLWAGWDDVWFLPQGAGVPFRVGSNIRPILQATPPELRYLWHASYFDGFYRLHLLSPGQNEGHLTRPGEEWRLDLRDRPPRSHDEARWYGPMIYQTPNGDPDGVADVGVAYTVVDTRPGVAPRLLGTTRSGNSEVMGQFEIQTPRDFGSFDMATVYGPGEWLQGTEILVDWQGREDDSGEPMVDKGYSGTEVNFWVSDMDELTVDDIIDGGREVATSSEIVPNTGFVADVAETDTDLLTRESQSLKLDVDEDTRPAGKVHQLRLYDAAGWFINEANDSPAILVTSSNNGVPTGLHTMTIPHGVYDTKAELLDELETQLELIGGTWSHNQQPTTLDENVEISETDTQWEFDVSTAASKRFWGMLGFDTENPPVAADTQTADSFMFLRSTALLELGGGNALLYPTRRRPL